MAEIKKRITQLGPASGPLDGTEVSAVVQGGVTKKIAESTKYGIGWWDKLKAGFVDFIAPEALHANDADTLGGETSAELHNAGALTGTAPLSAIPAELTGKNAATATLATNAGNATTATYATNAGNATKLANARTITIAGDATGSTTFDGSENKTITLSVGIIKNTYGATLPAHDASNHGRFFYLTAPFEVPYGLYYCAQTGSSTFKWIKIN